MATVSMLTSAMPYPWGRGQFIGPSIISNPSQLALGDIDPSQISGGSRWFYRATIGDYRLRDVENVHSRLR